LINKLVEKFRERRNDRKGFTLIELLVVIAILLAIAIPQYIKYRQNVFNVTALSDLKNVQTAAEAYFADHDVYP